MSGGWAELGAGTLFLVGLAWALVRCVRRTGVSASYEQTRIASLPGGLPNAAIWIGSWRRRFPFVSVVLVLATSLVSLAALAWPLVNSPAAPDSLTKFLALDPAGVAAGQAYRLFSLTLVNAGLVPLVFAMALLWYLGVNQQGEFKLGHLRWLAIYVASAIAASAVSLVTEHHIVVGSAGAVMGLAGAMAVARFIDLRQLALVHDSGGPASTTTPCTWPKGMPSAINAAMPT